MAGITFRIEFNFGNATITNELHDTYQKVEDYLNRL